MRTRIVKKLVKNMTTDEYRQCLSLNLRDKGNLRYNLPQDRRDGMGKVLMLKDDHGKVLSWALVREPFFRTGHHDIQIYTRASERRKGYGTRLMKQALKFDSEPVIYMHDQRSTAFFRNLGFREDSI